MDYVEARKHLIAWLRRQLIGPATENEIIHENPLKLYHTGILNPADSSAIIKFEEYSGYQNDSDDEEDFAYRSYYTAPSTVGFTFFVSHDAQLNVIASASHYESLGERDQVGRFIKQSYQRNELIPYTKTISYLQEEVFHEKIWEGIAGIYLKVQKHQNGFLCILALTNLNNRSENLNHYATVGLCLFEVQLICEVTLGNIMELSRRDLSLMREEEIEIEIQYKDRKIFAVGHGVAVDWDVEDSPKIWAEFMPEVEMPALSTNPQGDHRALDMMRCTQDDITILESSMMDFVTGYENWIVEQRQIVSELKEDVEREAGDRMVTRMEVSLNRMREGIKLLSADEDVEQAFRWMNKIMLHQMQQADRIADRDSISKIYRWRSFQLAFLLTVLESAVCEKSDFRETMDLIWFPTGGGKTEAYLGLIAILLIWRRLKYKCSGGGTVAIMRYTLRLLTRQQFERSMRMICALELLRRTSRDNRLGKEPFTVGLWVGSKVSPNTYSQALKNVKDIQDGDDSKAYNLIITNCPWCGEKLCKDGFHATNDSFSFYCRNHISCDFGQFAHSQNLPLPCNVIDEQLYSNPPSLLITTIDKFARLPWIDGPSAFFGTDRRAPELIIQDELHLVSGPLGSIAGIYEVAIETLIKAQGISPKYIASTATISEASKQIQSLYARDVRIFPPPGLSIDDMYFACTDRTKSGRICLGFLAPYLDQSKSMSPIAAALLVAPYVLFGQAENFEELAEAWWNTVVFNRSLRDIRNFHNELFHGVKKYGSQLINQFEIDCANTIEKNLIPSIHHRLQNRNIGELTSLRSAEQCALLLTKLANDRNHPECVDIVFATNMISVGLDISRLALMIVNGQPQTTGEYIQVTGRIGRDKVPGLVVVNFFRTQARSLTHYENFRPFHESFHRFVEPSNITPFTHQTRRRALHASLVIALRYLITYLKTNDSASKIGRESYQEEDVISQLIKRFNAACSDLNTQNNIRNHLHDLYQEWKTEAQRCNQSKRALNYSVYQNQNDADRLLKNSESSSIGLWNTLNSMRNVEYHAEVKCGRDDINKIRFSDLLGSSGVGSIVTIETSNYEQYYAVVKDVKHWPEGEEIKHIEHILRHLRISSNRLLKPHRATENSSIYNSNNCIPTKKFPTWQYCIKCGLLHQYPNQTTCSDESCNGQLKQVDWVLVHSSGYLADVDWHYMAHGSESKACERISDPYLILSQDHTNQVKCTKCDCHGWAEVCYYGRSTWQQPWIKIPPNEDMSDLPAEVIQIGDSRLYREIIHRALVIPPESRISKSSIIDQLYRSSSDLKSIEKSRSGLHRKSTLKRIASKFRCEIEMIEDAYKQIKKGYPLYGKNYLVPPYSSQIAVSAHFQHFRFDHLIKSYPKDKIYLENSMF